jgi:hypothetical protein
MHEEISDVLYSVRANSCNTHYVEKILDII